MPRNLELEKKLGEDPKARAFFNAVKDSLLEALCDKEMLPGPLREGLGLKAADPRELRLSNAVLTLVELAAYVALETVYLTVENHGWAVSGD